MDSLKLKSLWIGDKIILWNSSQKIALAKITPALILCNDGTMVEIEDIDVNNSFKMCMEIV